MSDLISAAFPGSEEAESPLAAASLSVATDAGELIEGSDDGDVIRALGGDDTVYGRGGGDSIDGGDGDDELWGSAPGQVDYYKVEIDGGAGNDVIHASDGGSVLVGGVGDDVLFGGEGQDDIHVGPGSDVVAAGEADDIVYVTLDGKADRIDGGGNGYYGDLLALDGSSSTTALDVDGSRTVITLADGTTVENVERLDIRGSAHADRLVGRDQADGSYAGDFLRGGLGDDVLEGRAGDDKLYGEGGDDTLLGGSGDDELYVRAGSGGLADGGAGTDVLRLDAVDEAGRITANAIVGDLSTGRGTLSGGLTVRDVEAVYVTGTTLADDLSTGDGDDFIRGEAGDDRFSTGAGGDWIDGGAGADAVDAGDGNDTIVVTGGEGGDRIDGGAGYDELKLEFWDSTVPLDVSVDGTTVTLGDGTRAVGIEKVSINASNLGDVIRTGASNDAISARGGNDYVDSGAGNDIVGGGEGDNTVFLGAGDDQAIVYLDTGRSAIDGGAGTDTIEIRLLYPEAGVRMDMKAGTLGDEGTITGVEKAVIYGWNGVVDVVTLDGEDLVYAGAEGDRIVTNGGDDVIYASSGDDYVDAGAGSDYVSAGEGDDTIVVLGNDEVDGEGGSDLAVFSGNRADYGVMVSNRGAILVTETATGRTAAVSNVERFAFADATFSSADVSSAEPKANPDAPPEISEDAPLATGSLTANDVSTSGTRAALVGPSGPAQSLAGRYGTLTVSSDNTFSYVPGQGAQALREGERVTDVFAYRITDAAGRSSDSTVTLSIVGSNDAPRVAEGSEVARGTEDGVVRGQLLPGLDAEGDKLSFGLVEGSARNGAVTIDAATGAYAFTPDKDFNGVASFSYAIGDGKLSSAAKTVTLTIVPSNDAPTAAAAPETFRGREDAVLSGTLLAGSDADGDVAAFRLVEGSARNGTVVVDPATGAFSFTPAANHAGPAEFSYVVTDGSLLSTPKTVSLTFDPVNDAPLAAAAAEAFRVAEDATLKGQLSKGYDADGDTLTYQLVAGSATHGAVSVDAATGAFSFAPATNHNGAAEFRYRVFDGTAYSAEKTASVAVDPVNDGPVARDDAGFSVEAGKSLAIRPDALLSNDIDPDGDRLLVTGVTGAVGGTVSLDADGTLSFSAASGFSGAGGFTYAVSDGNGGVATAKVSVAIVGGASAPAINGTDRADMLCGTDASEAINGRGGIDLILAGAGDDVVHGDGGSDVVHGDKGLDRLFGDAGHDALFGGDGNDVLDGGTGHDVLTGGAGADVFVFRKGGGNDTVTDFQAGLRGADVLDVSALGFRSLDEVKAAAHEVKLFGMTLGTVIEASDGTSINLALTGVSDLHKGDFLFA